LVLWWVNGFAVQGLPAFGRVQGFPAEEAGLRLVRQVLTTSRSARLKKFKDFPQKRRDFAWFDKSSPQVAPQGSTPLRVTSSELMAERELVKDSWTRHF